MQLFECDSLDALVRPEGGIMTPMMRALMPVMARVFVASEWYDTGNLPSTLYCKAREVISGDRAERIAQDAIDKDRQDNQGGIL